MDEMKRTKTKPTRLPDAIRLSPGTGFTQIKNDMLRDSKISYKAKGLLCLLLSNESGKWISYQQALEKFGTDGPDALRSGLNELRNAGYLIKIYYVDKITKRRRGSFWAYTDFPGHFNMEGQLNFLDDNGLEVQGGKFKPDFPSMGSPSMGEPIVGNPRLIILNTNNTKLNKTNTTEEEEKPSCPFEKIKELYHSICISFPKIKTLPENRKKTIRARWNQYGCQLREFEELFTRAEQSEFLKGNNDRNWHADFDWLINESNMTKTLEGKYNKELSTNSTSTSQSANPKKVIRKYFKDKDLAEFFYRDCYVPASSLFVDVDGRLDENKLAARLIDLYSQIVQAQNKNLTDDLRGLLPGPMALVQAFLMWIENASAIWLKDRSVNLLTVNHTNFKKFRNDEAAKDNMQRDPLTGESYMRG